MEPPQTARPARRLAAAAFILVLAAVAAAAVVWWSLTAAPTTGGHAGGVHAPTSRGVPPTEAADADPTHSRAAYAADLSLKVRPPEFSAGTVKPTRKGKRPMLGRFGADGVNFTLDGLPPHAAAHVVMDLAILNSWNGSNPYWGPDVWACDEGESTPRRHLFAASFCNCGFFSNNNEQSFPDESPAPPGAVPHSGWTGAAERQTLGETLRFTNTDPVLLEDCTSVYHLDWTFPHAGPTLALRFTGHFKQQKMRFAFLGFYVETVATLARPSAAELDADWAALGSDDAVRANAAVWSLAATGDTAVDLLRARLAHPDIGPPASPYRPGRVAHLLEVINSPASTTLAADLSGKR